MKTIICDDAIHYLNEQSNNSIPNIITGLPDLDEMNLSFDDYLKFFVSTIELIMDKINMNGFLFFLQTDRLYKKTWLDKSSIIINISKQKNLNLLFHKIILNRDVGKINLHRPTYSHFLCFSRFNSVGIRTPDVIHSGTKIYKNASSFAATQVAIDIIKKKFNYPILDPFNGRGTTTSLCELNGIDSIGVDIDSKQCEYAEKL
jgi:hypothetical protein